MSRESDPLIAETGTRRSTGDEIDATIDVYDRFSESEKRLIFALILWMSLISPFVWGTFGSGFLNIARDLNLDVVSLNCVVGVYILVKAIGGLFWGSYATFYGRQFVFMISLPIVCLGCLGVAFSRTMPELLFSRVLQAIGVSSITSTSIAIISDIYRPEHRGTVVGILSGNPIVVLAPFLSGIVISYSSWRIMHIILSFMSCFGLFLSIIILPETSHPGTRGIENAQGILSSNNRIKFSNLAWSNPFKSLSVLNMPVVGIWALSTTFSFMTGEAMWDSLAVTYNDRYKIESPIVIGLCFLPADIGMVFGSIIAGYLSDRALIKSARRHGGTWIPEDRLHVAFLASTLLLPPSVLLSALALEYIRGTLGFVINLACLFINCFGIAVVQVPAFAYMLDIQRERSAETRAINYAFENMFTSIVSATVLPCINNFGLGWTFSGVAVIGWIGSFLLRIIIRYGDRLKDE